MKKLFAVAGIASVLMFAALPGHAQSVRRTPNRVVIWLSVGSLPLAPYSPAPIRFFSVPMTRSASLGRRTVVPTLSRLIVYPLNSAGSHSDSAGI